MENEERRKEKRKRAERKSLRKKVTWASDEFMSGEEDSVFV